MFIYVRRNFARKIYESTLLIIKVNYDLEKQQLLEELQDEESEGENVMDENVDNHEEGTQKTVTNKLQNVNNNTLKISINLSIKFIN